MEIPSLNFTSLRCLQEVERRGSFTEAAWELGISQPALSYSLAELSKRLGAPLFRKDGRRRVLTEAGRRAARYADQVLGQTNDLLRWLEGWERGEVGTLRVGMIDTAGLYTLPAGLSRLRREHSAIDLQLVVADSGDLLSMLDDYRIDLAFVVGPAGPRYHSTPITTDRMHIYSPNGPAPEGWALYPPGSRTRLLVDQGLAQLGIRPLVASSRPTRRCSARWRYWLCPDGAPPTNGGTRGCVDRGPPGGSPGDRGGVETGRGPRSARAKTHEHGAGGLTPHIRRTPSKYFPIPPRRNPSMPVAMYRGRPWRPTARRPPGWPRRFPASCRNRPPPRPPCPSLRSVRDGPSGPPAPWIGRGRSAPGTTRRGRRSPDTPRWRPPPR